MGNFDLLEIENLRVLIKIIGNSSRIFIPRCITIFGSSLEQGRIMIIQSLNSCRKGIKVCQFEEYWI